MGNYGKWKMSKDLESLQVSRDRRAEIKMKYDFIPTSIMEAEKQKHQAKDPHAEKRNYYSTTNVKFGTIAHDIFDVSGQSCRGKSGALSGYPQNVGRYLVKMYSSEGDIILDPFAGHNSRMELCFKLNRDYIGYDISAQFMEANRLIAKQLQGSEQAMMFKGQSIRLIEDDALNISLEEKADMCLTSPPYWDLEYYGDEPKQLGKCQTYSKFIDSLGAILQRCFANLKDGAYCCWSVNDFRKNGIFYPYHSSVITLFGEVRFKLHDIIIVDLGYPIGAAFATQLEEQKRTAKRHEYIIIGRK